MSDKDEGGGLFRRMARKVAAPARELVGMTPRETDIRPTEFDKAEMKAMIERKRRNDYVRKRELDTLRRIRREGLSGDQAHALTMQSSRMDESVEARSTLSSVQSVGIKAKIDAIERQMVGANSGVSAGSPAAKPPRTAPTLPPGPPPPILTATIFDAEENAPTLRVPFSSPDDENETVARLDGGPLQFDGLAEPQLDDPDTAPATLNFANTMAQDGVADDPFAPPRGVSSSPPMPHHAPLEFTTTPTSAFVPALQTVPMPFDTNPYAAGAPAPRTAPTAQSTVDLGNGERVEISEVVHDEALDEAVIAFAGGDFAGCEKALQMLVGARGERRDHDETWLVLFDLYRAIGQQTKFETVTMEYVERFHRSAPQWFSLPKQLAEATKKPESGKSISGGIGWVCPPNLDSDGVARLDALSMQLPSPWVMDWTALASVDVEAASRLLKLFVGWANQPLSLSWIAGDTLFAVLHELAPTGVRDADPVYWMLRLEALRLAHRPDQFDEVAIDYCVTFEVSPPSWENARCKAQLIGTTQNTQTLSLSVVGEATTSFMDTSLIAEDVSSPPAQVQITSVELAGQLSGDLAELLGRLTKQVGDSRVIRISCALLMRVDFVAAGDLLNWVAQRHSEGREIVFHETHRLVALMFGAMGINETARVQLRHV
ncbi:MAG: STAS domain-containing protein [Burkholderiaceae bacterium]